MFDIEYIAKLSKLDCDDVKKYIAQMEEIIILADEIHSSEITESTPVISQYCDLREDIPKASNSEIPFKNNFTVPKII